MSETTGLIIDVVLFGNLLGSFDLSRRAVRSFGQSHPALFLSQDNITTS